jgi:hypothetical protein
VSRYVERGGNRPVTEFPNGEHVQTRPGSGDDDHAGGISVHRAAVVEQADDSVRNWTFVHVIRDSDPDMLRSSTAGCNHEERHRSAQARLQDPLEFATVHVPEGIRACQEQTRLCDGN